MLVTLFGNISIELDDKRVSFEIQRIEANSKVFPDVEAYLIRWKYQSDGGRHFLRCIIDCEATEVQTWFAADPTITGNKVNWTKYV